MKFETEYQLQEWRDVESQHFNSEGNAYTGQNMSLSTQEQMLKLINQLVSELTIKESYERHLNDNCKINPRRLFEIYKNGKNWPSVNKSHENLFIIGGQSIMFRIDKLLDEFFESKINDEWQILQQDQQDQLIKEFSEYCAKNAI